jgi:predicted P-loop ATPase
MTAVTKIHPHLKEIEAPSLIRNLPGWLVWRFEYDDAQAKPRKVPYYTSGQRRHGVQGRPEDRQQLTTFDAARSAAARKGFDGVGFALMPEWGVVALDFDNCMVDGGVHPVVERLVAGTYAEYSPSGEGVRAFMRGDLGNNKSISLVEFGFETFSSKGFVTFTGNVLDITEMLGAEDTLLEVNQDVLALYAERFGAPEEDDPLMTHEPRAGLTQEQMAEALDALDPDTGHDDWLHVGMALHHETAGQGFDLWNEWSKKGGKYPGERVLRQRWVSFGKAGGRQVTARTLIKLANANGAHISLVATADEFDVVAVPADEKPLPGFKRDKQGNILATIENVTMAVARADICGLQIRYDEFRDEIMWARDGDDQWASFTDADYSRLRIQLERGGFKPIGRELIRDVVLLVAQEHPFDSAVTWLNQQTWDGVPRVESFLVRYFGAEDTEYTRAVSFYLWTALAGRVMSPGIKADMVPILVGGQGVGKSTGVAAMVPATDFFTEVSFHEKEDDLARRMRGRLLGEIGELRGLHTKELESIKAFITRTHESWVPKYREFAVTFPRRIVFVGTTNKDEFLADETGNRRWLPVRVERADVEAIKADRLQLWAEARHLFDQHGIQYRQAEALAGDVHVEHTISDPWEDAVAKWLDEPDHLTGMEPRTREFLRGGDVLREALNIEPKHVKKYEEMRVGNVLRAFGYARKKVRVEGKTIWAWVPTCSHVEA